MKNKSLLLELEKEFIPDLFEIGSHLYVTRMKP